MTYSYFFGDEFYEINKLVKFGTFSNNGTVYWIAVELFPL